MKWIEASIYTTTEAVDILTAFLLEQGITGVQIEDDEEMKHFLKSNLQKNNYADYIEDNLLNKDSEEVKVKFYVTQDLNGNKTLLSIKESLPQLVNSCIDINLGRLFLEVENVDDEDWEHNWKKYYKPFNIGQNIIIKPEWENYDNTDNKIVFNINPGHLFGTGLHQTTQLVIVELEKHITKSSKVLDLGCGTGILSIISLLLNAEQATAVDIEPSAIDIAYENAKINGVDKEKYTVLSGNVLEDETLSTEVLTNKYNLVIVNIVADVIIQLLDFINKAIDKGGTLIASGIIIEREEDVKIALEEKGFEVKNIYNKDNWICIVSTKK